MRRPWHSSREPPSAPLKSPLRSLRRSTDERIQTSGLQAAGRSRSWRHSRPIRCSSMSVGARSVTSRSASISTLCSATCVDTKNTAVGPVAGSLCRAAPSSRSSSCSRRKNGKRECRSAISGPPSQLTRLQAPVGFLGFVHRVTNPEHALALLGTVPRSPQRARTWLDKTHGDRLRRRGLTCDLHERAAAP